MHKIKFRGIEIETGKFFYGDLIQSEKDFFIREQTPDPTINILHKVDPFSIAQFVGIDENGNEIYEGDVIEFYHGEPLSIHLTVELVDKYQKHFFPPVINYSWLPGYDND